MVHSTTFIVCPPNDPRFARHVYRRFRYDHSKSATTHDRTHRYGHGLVGCRTSLRVRTPTLGAVQDGASPTTESVSDTLAFIRWTTPNPGGTILHYAIVRFGTDPNHLEFTAKSPTRINPGRSEMVFRVRIQDLQPGTTYYYKVCSEQATGISDPAMSSVNQFSTRPANSMSATK